jgi:hypothetical protein
VFFGFKFRRADGTFRTADGIFAFGHAPTQAVNLCSVFGIYVLIGAVAALALR